MTFEMDSCIERLDLLHILLRSPALFLPLTSQHFQFYPPVVQRSKYDHILSMLQTKRTLLQQFYDSWCKKESEMTYSNLYKGDFYQAMRVQDVTIQEGREIYVEVIDSLWSQALEGHEMADGCNPFELLKNLTALLFTDESLLKMYSSVFHTDDEWSYNDVFEFFDLIYHLYDKVTLFTFFSH